MNTALAKIVGVVSTLICIGVLVPQVMRVFDAQEAADGAARGVDGAVKVEHEIQTLRAAAPLWLSKARPTGDVAGLLQATIRDAGLPVTVLTEVAPSESAAAPQRPANQRGTASSVGGVWGEMSVMVRLAPIPLTDLGTFLDRWRTSHPEWAVTAIDLNVHDRPGDPAPGAPYAASIRLTASFVE